MGYGTCELMASSTTDRDLSFKVVVETGMKDLVRLNVARLRTGSDDYENSQGVDLTASECRALANMLNATADLIS
jgi:hypothetical protein